MTARLLDRGVNRMRQLRPMRTLPIDLPTAATRLKTIVVLSGQRQERRFDRSLRDLEKFGVAAKTAREGLEHKRTKMSKHFDELSVRVCATNEVTVCHNAALEEPAIARQENSPFANRDISEFVIAGARGTNGVETDDAQAFCQLAEMAVEHEPNRGNGIGPNVCECGDVETLEPGKDGDAIRVGHQVTERHRFPVDENQVNLGMWHAEPLNQILHGSRPREAHGDADLPLRERQEIVESAIDSDRHLLHEDALEISIRSPIVPPVTLRCSPIDL